MRDLTELSTFLTERSIVMAEMCLSKIVFLLPTLEGGGAERVFVILANKMADLGYEVDLVVVNGVGPYRGEVQSNVNLVDLKKKRVALSILMLREFFNHRKPNCIISALAHLNIAAIIASKLSNSSHSIVVSERVFSNFKNRDSGLIKFLMVEFLAWIFYPKADGIICVSKELARILTKKYKIAEEKMAVLYNPVPSFPDEANTQLVIEKFGKEFILAAGRLEKQKGFDFLIEAFAIASKEIQNNLVILGDGSERKYLNEKIEKLGLKDRVFLPGFFLNPLPFFKSAHLFVLSSYFEGLPNVLLQALASGTQIISTDCPTGPSEILENGKWGKLVEVNNKEQMSGEIINSCKKFYSPSVSERIYDFTPEKIAKELETILKNFSKE